MSDNEQEFWESIETHRAALWRFALGLTRSREDASDLVSDAVLEAHRAYETLRDRTKLKSVLFTIVVRLHKRRTWRRRIFSVLDHVIETAGEAAAGVHHFTRESSYDLEQLMRALETLPERQRETVLLFELSEFSLEEIREIQGGTLSGVKTRLVRGRETLRKLLTEPEHPIAFRQTGNDSNSRPNRYELRKAGSQV